jgi:Mg/Co/Ni transporter MgtE
MSPRAAWRLEGLGYDAYDYVASKMDWMGAGLPIEGSEAELPRLGALASTDVPTCSLDETVGAVRGRLNDWGMCVVINDARVVLGLVRAEALELDDARPIGEISQEAPKTFRPHLTPKSVMSQLEQTPRPWLLVTNNNGTLVGVARPDDVRKAKGPSSG